MFSTEMSEKKTGEIILEHVEPSVMKFFLQHLYKMDEGQKSSLDSSPNRTEDLNKSLEAFQLAHGYQIKGLVGELTKRIISTPSESLELIQVLKIYEVGYTYDLSDLKFRAKEWIKM